MNAQTTTSTELDDALRQQFGTAAHTTPLQRVSTWGFAFTAST